MPQVRQKKRVKKNAVLVPYLYKSCRCLQEDKNKVFCMLLSCRVPSSSSYEELLYQLTLKGTSTTTRHQNLFFFFFFLPLSEQLLSCQFAVKRYYGVCGCVTQVKQSNLETLPVCQTKRGVNADLIWFL